jgi:hypothetical protein
MPNQTSSRLKAESIAIEIHALEDASGSFAVASMLIDITTIILR